jgi:hypothetical protein
VVRRRHVFPFAILGFAWLIEVGCNDRTAPLSPIPFSLPIDAGSNGDAGFGPDAGDAGLPPDACRALQDAGTVCTPGLADLSTASSYDVGNGYFALATADLNGDGLLDLVAGSYANGPGSIDVYFGLPDGGLSSPASYPGDGRSLALGDVNADGLVDIVATSLTAYPCGFTCDHAVSVFFNLGDGGFALAASYVPDAGYLSGNIVAVAIGDLNGDCWPDLVVETNSGTQLFLLNQGNGTFDQFHPLELWGGYGGLVVADLNHDGRDDISLAATSPSAAVVLAVLLTRKT